MKQLIKLHRIELDNGAISYIADLAAFVRESKAIHALSPDEMRQQLWRELVRLSPGTLKGDLLEFLYTKFPAFLHVRFT